MSDLPDPPEPASMANIADALAKIRAINGSIFPKSLDHTGSADAATAGADLSRDLRRLEANAPQHCLATLAKLEEIDNHALQCRYRNLLVRHLPNPPGLRNPQGKCRPIDHFDPLDGTIRKTDWRR